MYFDLVVFKPHKRDCLVTCTCKYMSMTENLFGYSFQFYS